MMETEGGQMLEPTLAQLSVEDMDAIHAATIQVLRQRGIGVPHEAALETFKRHGFRVADEIVFIEEEQLMAAIEAAPATFTIHARNPERSVHIGGGRTVLAPGYGAPFLADPEKGIRKADLADYLRLVRLAHALPNQDMTGFLLVQPDDLDAQSAHLHMLEAHLTQSDKPFFGSTEGEAGARHTLEMTAIGFGMDPADLAGTPACIGLINTLSPLHFSEEMLGALVCYAENRQPVLVAAAAMAGSTAPITLAGMLVQQNAEILAGITLAQLIAPGTPVVYGSTSTNMDMRTGAMAIGSPELALLITATAQLARRYGLPSRSGGALSDAHGVDARAGYESSFSLLTAFNSGIDIILHAAGILSSYLVFSMEKFVLDDELCGMVRHYRNGLAVNEETLALDSIMMTGQGGNYLKDPLTLARCRTEFWDPAAYARESVQEWIGLERPLADELARARSEELLLGYEEPAVSKTVRDQLTRYIEEHTLE